MLPDVTVVLTVKIELTSNADVLLRDQNHFAIFSLITLVGCLQSSPAVLDLISGPVDSCLIQTLSLTKLLFEVFQPVINSFKTSNK